MTILRIQKRIATRPWLWVALCLITVSAVSFLYAQGGPGGPPAGGPPGGAPPGAAPPGGAPPGGAGPPGAGPPGAGGAPGGAPAGGGTPKLELDTAGGPDCIPFAKVPVVGLKKLTIETTPGNPEEVLEFTYFDPHPDYTRPVHVRIPSYYTEEKRTQLGWYARFRWWEVLPEWKTNDQEMAARALGTVSKSKYVTSTTESDQLPKWLKDQPEESPAEMAATFAGAMVGSQYVLGR